MFGTSFHHKIFFQVPKMFTVLTKLKIHWQFPEVILHINNFSLCKFRKERCLDQWYLADTINDKVYIYGRTFVLLLKLSKNIKDSPLNLQTYDAISLLKYINTTVELLFNNTVWLSLTDWCGIRKVIMYDFNYFT